MEKMEEEKVAMKNGNGVGNDNGSGMKGDDVAGEKHKVGKNIDGGGGRDCPVSPVLTFFSEERSRSRSKEKKSQRGDDVSEQELAEKKARRKAKKKRSKKRTYRQRLGDPQVQNNIKNDIDNDDKIPEEMKEKFKEIELNPFAIMISNLPVNVSEQELKHYFNTFMKSLEAKYDEQNTNPLDKVEIGDDRKYGVLYMIDHDAAEKLFDIGKLEYRGYKIKISRPKGFFSELYKYMAQEDYFDKQLMKEQHKLYMGNIPTYLTEEEIRKLLISIGPLKYFNLIKNYVNDIPVSRGYCFIEYQDPRMTDKAIKALNGLEIGEKKIKMQRVSNDAPDNFADEEEQAKAKKGGRLKPSNAGGSFLNNCPLVENPLVKAMLSIPQGCIIPSRVVQFLNMFSPEDLFDEDFYQELCDDVKQECEKYGSIEKIDIPRPDHTGLCSCAVGKVFVKFYYIRSAKRCRYKLNGEFPAFYSQGLPYNGRTVLSSFFPEDDFERKEYLNVAV